MKIIFFLFLIFLISCTPKVQNQTSFASTRTFQLATPQLKIDSVLFQKTGTAQLELRQKGTQIRYTLDGSAVTENSPSYSSPIQFSQSSILKSKAFHSDFLPSETIQQSVARVTPFPKNTVITVTPNPHPSYNKGGISILSDLATGTENFKSGHWLGFKSKEVNINIKQNEPKTFSTIHLRILKNHRSWIFMPQRIEIYTKGEQIGSISFETPTEHQPTSIQFIAIPLNHSQKSLEDLQIKIINLPSIPDFHNGKGYTPWLFIDEIWIE